MLDRGLTVRCVAMWAAFLLGATGILIGVLLDLEPVWVCGRVSAAVGFLLVILNDNARTRREIRVAMMAMGRDPDSRLSRVP